MVVKRPRLCPDFGCEPLWWMGSDEWFDKGGSFECYGKRSEPMVYTFREVEHRNDLNHCIFGPFGIYNFKENVGDLQNVMMAVAHLLRKLDPHFDWERSRSYYSGEDPNVDKWRRIYGGCESKVHPEGEGVVTCRHTGEACTWYICPSWRMN